MLVPLEVCVHENKCMRYRSGVTVVLANQDFKIFPRVNHFALDDAQCIFGGRGIALVCNENGRRVGYRKQIWHRPWSDQSWRERR